MQNLKEIHDDLQARVDDLKEKLIKHIDKYVKDLDTEEGMLKRNRMAGKKLVKYMDTFFKEHTTPFLIYLALRIRDALQIAADNFDEDDTSLVDHLQENLGIKDGKIRAMVDGKLTILFAIGMMKVLENDMVMMVNNSINGDVTRHMLRKNLHASVSRKYHDFFEVYAMGAFMQTYNTAQLIYARKHKREKFLYVGGLIDESRDFCQERDGHEFTFDQGKEWDNLWWKGKIEGVPFFIQIGGYNCRHHLQWLEND